MASGLLTLPDFKQCAGFVETPCAILARNSLADVTAGCFFKDHDPLHA